MSALPFVRNIDRRRAVLGVLLRAGHALTVKQLLDTLRSEGIDGNRLQGLGSRSAAKVVVDVLRHQMALGRVRRVRRATYELLPETLSRSMRWRCLHWRQLCDAWWEAHGAMPDGVGLDAPSATDV